MLSILFSCAQFMNLFLLASYYGRIDVRYAEDARAILLLRGRFGSDITVA